MMNQFSTGLLEPEVEAAYAPIASSDARVSEQPIVGPPAVLCPTATRPVVIRALTTFSPDAASAELQRRNVASWRAAGCEVVAFQAGRELAGLKAEQSPDRWVEVADADTGLATFGRPLIPISHMLRWALASVHRDEYALVINADNRLVAPPPMLRDLATFAGDGLCYIHRHDVDYAGTVTRQKYGIDGFLFRVSGATLMPHSTKLCAGRPHWDWLLPLAFLAAKRRLYTPRFPIAYHRMHPLRWSDADHRITGAELARLTKRRAPDVAAAWQEFRRWAVPVDVNPEWAPLAATPRDL